MPPRVIDQRFGRAAVLEEAVNDALPELYGEAVARTRSTSLGQPEVEVTEFDDGEQPEVHRRGRRPPRDRRCRTSRPAVAVDDVEVTDEDVDEQIDALRERFATLNGGRARGRSRRRLRHHRPVGHASTARSVEDGSAPRPVLRGRQRPAPRRPRRGRHRAVRRRVARPSPPRWSAASTPARTPTSRSPSTRSRSGAARARRRVRPDRERVRHPRRAARRRRDPARPASGSSRASRPGTSVLERLLAWSTCRCRRASSQAEIERRQHDLEHQLEHAGMTGALPRGRGARPRRSSTPSIEERAREASRRSSCSTWSPSSRS